MKNPTAPTAVEMGKLRWKNKTKKQRRAHALLMVEAKRAKRTKQA